MHGCLKIGLFSCVEQVEFIITLYSACNINENLKCSLVGQNRGNTVRWGLFYLLPLEWGLGGGG